MHGTIDPPQTTRQRLWDAQRQTLVWSWPLRPTSPLFAVEPQSQSQRNRNPSLHPPEPDPDFDFDPESESESNRVEAPNLPSVSVSSSPLVFSSLESSPRGRLVRNADPSPLEVHFPFEGQLQVGRGSCRFKRHRKDPASPLLRIAMPRAAAAGRELLVDLQEESNPPSQLRMWFRTPYSSYVLYSTVRLIHPSSCVPTAAAERNLPRYLSGLG
ncbi:hypothetical protein BJ875DRAFT_547573 [Amylocarpus encephaloides]|uniref:Uncharacterized protein n=1 Tax=Amylocarpus encephaloides TaxID=45428 RepID=A0A9P7Y7U8_9HELO|nr:hypothetical protein BJ875DRAFT_547573 [Amylocarpus encephaloides]